MNDRSVGFLGAWLLLMVLASGAAQPAQGDVPPAAGCRRLFCAAGRRFDHPV
ncbi:hypothetical protein [Candidatus Amarolinea dominans]|uniref:hypothetical protein n=1 Tax=Candidatus Amarolinea dominans TaxID=3140696 RepID=UPI0031369D69|nr:hypothetical protein [Anaerolineae bacterium]